MDAMLAANLSAQALTTSITNGQDLLLYRTLDLPEDPRSASLKFSAALPSPPPTLKTSLARVHAPSTTREFRTPRNSQHRLAIPTFRRRLASRPDEGAMTALAQVSHAGVTGALAGAS